MLGCQADAQDVPGVCEGRSALQNIIQHEDRIITLLEQGDAAPAGLNSGQHPGIQCGLRASRPQTHFPHSPEYLPGVFISDNLSYQTLIRSLALTPPDSAVLDSRRAHRATRRIATNR